MSFQLPRGKASSSDGSFGGVFLSSKGVVPVQPAVLCDCATLNHVVSRSSLFGDHVLRLGRPAVEGVRVGLQASRIVPRRQLAFGTAQLVRSQTETHDE